MASNEHTALGGPVFKCGEIESQGVEAVTAIVKGRRDTR